MIVKNTKTAFIVAMFLILTSQVQTFSHLDSANSNHSSSFDGLESLPSAKNQANFPSLLAALVVGLLDGSLNELNVELQDFTPGTTCSCSMC